MKTEINEMKKENNEMKKEKNEMKKEKNEMKKEINEMKKEKNEMKKEKNEMKKENNQLKNDNNYLSGCLLFAVLPQPSPRSVRAKSQGTYLGIKKINQSRYLVILRGQGCARTQKINSHLSQQIEMLIQKDQKNEFQIQMILAKYNELSQKFNEISQKKMKNKM